MAIIRGPDGKPIGAGDEGTEETTRRVERRSIRERVAPREDSQESPTGRNADREQSEVTDPVGGGGASAGETPAKAAAKPDAQKEKPMSLPKDDAPATQIVGGRRSKPKDDKKSEDGASALPGSTGLSDPMEDPVVGWVVIVEGPGQGASLTLGYGMNSIGRAPSERLCLDFGDNQISRTQHATITYDPRGRKYFVSHGGGKNLTYLGEEPVLMPVELKGGEELAIGDTKIRFVPFCGKEFDWRDK